MWVPAEAGGRLGVGQGFWPRSPAGPCLLDPPSALCRSRRTCCSSGAVVCRAFSEPRWSALGFGVKKSSDEEARGTPSWEESARRPPGKLRLPGP